MALVPAAALLGHSGRSAARLSWKEKGLFGKERALCLDADRPYRAGEPVEMNFGGEGKIDPQVLLDHGLWDRASFCGGYALQLNLPEGPSYEDKVDILELSGLGTYQTFLLREGEPVPPELVAFLRLVNLGGEDAWLLEPIFRESLWKEVLMFPVSEENERVVCDSITAHCRGLLSQYPPPHPERAKARVPRLPLASRRGNWQPSRGRWTTSRGSGGGSPSWSTTRSAV